MISAAPSVIQIYLSFCAVIGLVALRQVIVSRDRYAPLNRRFLFALNMMILIFAARVLVEFTGLSLFRTLVLIGAALVPLAALLLAEGLIRRHAPKWLKLGVAIGSILLAISAFAPSHWVDPARLISLMGLQVFGLGAAAWMVWIRDRTSLSQHENVTAERISMSIGLLLPLAAGDFIFVALGLPAQISPLGVLFLCWLALTLERSEHRFSLFGFAILMLAGAVPALVITVVFSATWMSAGLIFAMLAATALATTLVFVAQNRIGAANRPSLLSAMTHSVHTDPETFLREVWRVGAGEDLIRLNQRDLDECNPGVLAQMFDQFAMIGRADMPFAQPDFQETAEALFERYDATHLICARSMPLVVFALSLPDLNGASRAELELGAALAQARLLEAAETRDRDAV